MTDTTARGMTPEELPACKTCRFWKESVMEGSSYGMSGKIVDTDWKRGCVRFPKWEVTLSSHYCGEHQPFTTPEPRR